jgi:glycosyltransferase involved in cell wall biosynthesis
MDFLDDITPLLITHNEIANIERTLAALAWARRIVVVDSGSTAGTLEVLARDPRIETVHRPFDSFAGQCNFGLGHVRTGWVLSMDADYRVSEALAAELRALSPPPGQAGYRARFTYCIHGHPLSGSLYPPRTVLYRVAGARYEDVGHGHRIVLDGPVGDLRGILYHDDRKPHARWLAAQVRYTAREADHLLTTPRAALKRVDRLRLMGWPAPILVFFYVLFAKRTVLDGAPGWYYAWQRVYAEVLLAMELLDRRMAADEERRREGGPNTQGRRGRP